MKNIFSLPVIFILSACAVYDSYNYPSSSYQIGDVNFSINIENTYNDLNKQIYPLNIDFVATRPAEVAISRLVVSNFRLRDPSTALDYDFESRSDDKPRVFELGRGESRATVSYPFPDMLNEYQSLWLSADITIELENGVVLDKEFSSVKLGLKKRKKFLRPAR